MHDVSVNIIHRTERVERFRVLEKELEEQGITKVNIWEGIHNVKSIKAGINAAHKQIIQWAKDEGLKKVVVLEDDVRFSDVGAWQYYLDNEPEDYDIYLGGIYLGKIVDGLVESFTALHCYTISERFYDIFLSTDNEKHLDEALAGLGRYFVCTPMVAIQHNGFSDSSQTYCNFDSITSSRKLYKSNQTNNACT